MGKKTEHKAVESVRAIRDRQAKVLNGKKSDQVIAFFRKAGDHARHAIDKTKRTRRAVV